mgnify:CR=1 FL=1
MSAPGDKQGDEKRRGILIDALTPREADVIRLYFGLAGQHSMTLEEIGETFDLTGYQITLEAVDKGQGPNYLSTMATMAVARDGRSIATTYPEKRVYPVQGMPTTEAAIVNGFFRDIYLVIGDEQAGGGWAVRSYVKPFANWIWAGSLIMALGGLLSLSDRRYRVAAGAAKQKPVQGVPAE